MTGTPITSDLTEGQKKQYRRFVEDAATKALPGIMKEGLQRLIENGGDFQEGLIALIQKFTVTDEFADEEVPSEYGYLSGYTPRSLTDQMLALKSIFPQLESFDVEGVARHPLLPGAEGIFLIPLWEKITPTYNQAVEIVLAKLSEQRNGNFYNYRDGELGPNQLRQTAKKAKLFQKLCEEQKGHDVLFVNAQFGLRHRGRSVQRARAVMSGNECGLGAFEIGVMLLTHPDRLANYDDLWLDCAGDEYAPGSDGVFSSAPYFNFHGEGLKFYTIDFDYPRGRCGSASAFVASAVPSE